MRRPLVVNGVVRARSLSSCEDIRSYCSTLQQVRIFIPDRVTTDSHDTVSPVDQPMNLANGIMTFCSKKTKKNKTKKTRAFPVWNVPPLKESLQV